MEIETSIKNLNTFFNKDKITLIEEKRGGIGGVFKKKLEFIHIKDSVKVVISDVELISNFKRTLKISLTDFEEIKIGIICIATNHIENEIPMSSCIVSTPNQYFIQNVMKEMRLFDSKSTCNFEELLFNKLNYPNVLDVKNQLG